MPRTCSTERSTGSPSQKLGSLFESGVDYLEIFDSEHSDVEDRFIAIGPIEGGIVVIVYTGREEDVIRIIGARWANPRERSSYRSYMEQKPCRTFPN